MATATTEEYICLFCLMASFTIYPKCQEMFGLDFPMWIIHHIHCKGHSLHVKSLHHAVDLHWNRQAGVPARYPAQLSGLLLHYYREITFSTVGLQKPQLVYSDYYCLRRWVQPQAAPSIPESEARIQHNYQIWSASPASCSHAHSYLAQVGQNNSYALPDLQGLVMKNLHEESSRSVSKPRFAQRRALTGNIHLIVTWMPYYSVGV